jgi:hypothetical protein
MPKLPGRRPRGKTTKRGRDYSRDYYERTGRHRSTQGLTDSDINTLEIAEDNTEQAIEAIGEALGRGLEEIGLVAEGYAKKLCPVDTGRLRNSITHIIDPEEKAAYIGTNVEYAERVEMDEKMKHTNGQAHFLRDAASDHGAKYREILEKHLRG